jgi:hypothetical protein
MLSELHTLNEIWIRAWLQKDDATVDRLMADDYVYVGPSGLVLDRLAILGIIRSPSYCLDYATRTDVVVRPIGSDAAVIRHRCQSAGAFEGTSFKEDHSCVMVCARRGAVWQVVMEQATPNSR